MKKIVFVSAMEACPWGGSEELWSRAALKLLATGAQVFASVKFWNPEAKRITELRSAGCNIRLRGTGRKPLGSHHQWAWIDHVKPDLVVYSDGANSLDASLARACRQFRIPLVVVFQAATEWKWPSDTVVKNVSELLESSAKVFCVSQANLDLSRKQYATEIASAEVIRNPFNVRYDADPPWPRGAISLACVGRLEPWHKGQDLAMEVLSQKKWRDRPVHLMLYGDGNGRTSLEALKKRLALKSVTFGGLAGDVESLWSKHHALLLPSRAEGLPLVIVEAMLCGRPCIVTDIAGNAELLRDNIDGFVAAAPIVSLLDQAMERAWSKRAAWRQMGKSAAAHVRTLVPSDPTQAFVHKLQALTTSFRLEHPVSRQNPDPK